MQTVVWIGKRLFGLTVPACFAVACAMLCAQITRADERIPLRPDMVINESAFGDATALVDEQGAIGDPGAGTGIAPKRPYFPGWTAWQYPLHIVIDLGAVRQTTRLLCYNETGEGQLVLETGTPTAWLAQTVTLNGYKAWKSFPLEAKTRYLRITLLKPTSLPEIALYGLAGSTSDKETPRAASVPVRRPDRPTMDQFIGTNAFIDDPVDKLAASVGCVREYHNWSWDTEAKDGKVRFQPSGAAGGNAWFFDNYYADLKSRGLTVCPAIQGSNPVYFPGVESDFKPIEKGKDPESPASYLIHAGHMFQYAARYGAAKVPDTLISLGAGQPRSTGLNSVHFFENWNEPDKTWKGREGRFSPFELAAMCSADYDGDRGRLGKAVGVRSADPNAKLVLGGLADSGLGDLGLIYLTAMKFWADSHRDGDFPADVINIHHYSSDGTQEQPFKNSGISPEADHLKDRLARLVQWRDKNVPKAEVWLSEFGYDTNPKSPFHAPATGSYSAEEIQAIWLVRSYFALAAARVDRAMMFMFRDTKSDGGGVFETSGLVTEKGQWKPKPSYFYVSALKERLKGMRFTGELETGVPDVLAYRFQTTGGKTAIAVWMQTSKDARANVTIKVGNGAVKRVDFTNDGMAGTDSAIPVANGSVSLEAREKPCLLLLP